MKTKGVIRLTEEKTAKVKRDAAFRRKDALLIALIILPLVFCLVLKVLFTPASEGVDISGALIYLEIPFPVQPLLITESQVNSWGVMLSILGLCLYLTHGLTEKAETKRQLIAEWIVEKCQGLVNVNMGERYEEYVYLIAAIMGLSAFSSLCCLCGGMFSPTGDLNVTAGWAILVFCLVTYTKLQGGFLNYMKGFTEPIVFFTPMNFISEFSLPVSMAFRHYGNVMSGAVISALVGAALRGLSAKLLGWIPVVGTIPLLQVGIPAVLSIYFDVFSGLMQAFIFAMLTMLNVSGSFPQEAWEKRQEKKAIRKQRAAMARA